VFRSVPQSRSSMAHGRFFEQGGVPSGDSALWQSGQVGGSSARLKSGGVSTSVRVDSREAPGQVPSFRQAQAGGRFGQGMETIGRATDSIQPKGLQS